MALCKHLPEEDLAWRTSIRAVKTLPSIQGGHQDGWKGCVVRSYYIEESTTVACRCAWVFCNLPAPVRSSMFKFSEHPNPSVSTIATNQFEPWFKPNGYVFHISSDRPSTHTYRSVNYCCKRRINSQSSSMIMISAVSFTPATTPSWPAAAGTYKLAVKSSEHSQRTVSFIIAI